MKTDTRRRLILYPVALVLLSGGVYGAFIYKAEPDAFTLLNGAEILAKVGEFDQAIEDAERAIKQSPDLRYGHIILGYCYAEKQNWEKSLGHYRRALELTPPAQPKRGLLRLHLAETLLSAGRGEEAEREALDVLATEPTRHQGWFVVARARIAAKRYDDARDACFSARAIDPEDLTPLILLSVIEKESGQPAAGLRWLQVALEMKPGASAAILRQVDLLVDLGRREEAVQAVLGVSDKGKPGLRNALAGDSALKTLLEDERVVRHMAGTTGKKAGN